MSTVVRTVKRTGYIVNFDSEGLTICNECGKPFAAEHDQRSLCSPRYKRAKHNRAQVDRRAKKKAGI